MSYDVPEGVFEHELVVKKSRFIARLLPVDSRDAVNAAVAQARLDYPDARHHCWAYLLGTPEDASSAGMSDDGEPAGTAGKPILNVLQHGHLGNVLVVVIRYFGGVKLGAGGLVRAYSAATQQVLEQAPAQTLRRWQVYNAQLDFSQEQSLRHFLSGAGAQIDAVDYGEGVGMRVRIALEGEEDLTRFCAGRGIVLTQAKG